MKPICPRCYYTGMDTVAAAPGARCPRCGEPLDQLPGSGAQASTLLTAAATATTTAPAFTPQSIMENQNAYAPSADAVFEDVLEIPSPSRSPQPTGEQMLVLEDVIPAEEFSMPDEIQGLEVEGMDDEEDTLLRTEPSGYVLPAEPERMAVERSPLAGPQVYATSETSSFDYDSGRAWLRLAPLLLLLGAFVFFALYFLGNRMGSWGSKPQEVAAKPAQPETQSPAQAAAEPQPSASNAVATVKEEMPAPVAKPSAEEAKPESKPVTAAPAPPAAATQATAPVAQQAAGNFTVQVGSYNNSAQADERAGQLRSGGVEARVVRAEIPRRGTWYRVQAGQFASREEAARFASELKAKGAADSFLIAESQGH